MKCLYCSKELTNPKAKFCDDKERMRFKREGKSEQITRTLITENPNKPEPEQITVETVTAPKILKFTNETPDKRIEMYKEMYPDSSFVPNWVRNGFNSKEDALQHAVRCINESKSVRSTGLTE